MAKTTTTELSQRSITRADVIFFLLVLGFLYTQLFQFPFTPYYFEGDNLLPISNAMRLLGGEVIYRDFFHLTPPGTELWYASLFTLFGVRIWVLNFTILLLNMGVAWFAWHFSRQFFTGLLVYLAPAIFLILGFRLFYIDGSYRLFSVLFAFAAIAVLMKGRQPRNLVLAGVSCGLASFFVQPRGVVAIAGISLFLIWEHFRREPLGKSLVKTGLLLLLPFLTTIAVTHAYFVWAAGFDNYCFSLVTFLQKHYPHDPLNRGVFLDDLPDFGQYLSIYALPAAIFRYLRIAIPILFFYALIPLVYLAFLIFRWRKRSHEKNDEPDRKLLLLSLVGLSLSAGVSAPSAIRLAHVAVPGLVVFVWFISRLKKSRLIAAASLAVLASIGVAYVVQRQTVTKYYLDMPAGRAAFFSEHYFRRYEWISKNTDPGDLFYEGHHPSFYFPFHLRNPTPMYLLRDSEYSPKFQVDGVVRSLKKDPPMFIAWPRKWTKAAEDRAPGDNLEDLCQFVHANYDRYVVFDKPLDYTPNSEGDIEIWKRKD
jgi:hypothetical protein